MEEDKKITKESGLEGLLPWFYEKAYISAGREFWKNKYLYWRQSEAIPWGHSLVGLESNAPPNLSSSYGSQRIRRLFPHWAEPWSLACFPYTRWHPSQGLVPMVSSASFGLFLSSKISNVVGITNQSVTSSNPSLANVTLGPFGIFN